MWFWCRSSMSRVLPVIVWKAEIMKIYTDWMVFIGHGNDGIPADGIHLISCILINFDLHILGILGVAIRRSHFLNPVISAF